MCRFKLLIYLLVILCSVILFFDCNSYADSQKRDKIHRARKAMVDLIAFYGVKDKQLLSVLREIPRHEFIPESHQRWCNPYGDHPCGIGHGQTISQPYTVAYMTEKLRLKRGEKVLEIGTGSGYQAAILSALKCRVYTVERIVALADHSKRVFKRLGFDDIKCRVGNGYNGWAAHAPYDAIIVTCAPDNIPPKLIRQLKENGRMIIPVGGRHQRLVFIRKRNGKISREIDSPVRFVPMVDDK